MRKVILVIFSITSTQWQTPNYDTEKSLRFLKEHGFCSSLARFLNLKSIIINGDCIITTKHQPFLFSTFLPSTIRLTVTILRPPPLIPTPKYSPSRRNRNQTNPKTQSNPVLKLPHRQTRYEKPVKGIISSDVDRTILIGESGISYKLPCAPFEFQFSYSETPNAKPVGIREPAFMSFDPPTMPMPRPRNGELPSRWDGPNGTVVLVNKPQRINFFYRFCISQVGHAGTLDPMATGLLIVCVGKATKVVDRYQGMIKGYRGVIQRESWEHIKDNDIKKALTSFLGEIWQVPPMFSAIKKLYDKARRGETVELSPRHTSIFQFDVERSLDDSYAHLTALRQDSIAEYFANDAWEFNDLEVAITKNYF
ncbi:unnamed protein product [Eruca vesicaria subsp. sativa]|uniref:tRNA pseudouridine(55) synthase n=1 Tax=Eruca vesicaria subsp. sativa TaxID=29727 RepID=A0ABC8M4J2_ERUVS|nr:unnamed protein product [Eruca vesicaria subsp. sativa]